MNTIFVGNRIDPTGRFRSTSSYAADLRREYQFVDDPEAEQIAASRSRPDLAVLRSEVLNTLRHLTQTREFQTVLGALAIDGPQSIAEISASIEQLPDEVEHTVSVLQRAGITLTTEEEDQPRYRLHPHGES
jgi:hypothetical protein